MKSSCKNTIEAKDYKELYYCRNRCCSGEGMNGNVILPWAQNRLTCGVWALQRGSFPCVVE